MCLAPFRANAWLLVLCRGLSAVRDVDLPTHRSVRTRAPASASASAPSRRDKQPSPSRSCRFHEGGIFNLQGSHTKESFKNFIFKAMNGKWSDYRDELASLREQYEESLEKRAQENEVAPGPALNEPSQRHREELEKEASGTAEDRTTAGDKKRRKRGRKSKAASAEANKPETSKLSSEELA